MTGALKMALSSSMRLSSITNCISKEKLWESAAIVAMVGAIRKFVEVTQGANAGKNTVSMDDYGQVLKSGWGRDPPNDVKEWMQKNYDASWLHNVRVCVCVCVY